MTAPTPQDIATTRKSVGWTQHETAAQLGVSVQAVRNWEQGRDPINDTAWLLLRILTHPACRRAVDKAGLMG